MRAVIAGNWKMHHGPSETRDFFRRFRSDVDPERVSLVVFPPALSLTAARDSLGPETTIGLGIQNIHWEAAGAFTGETSAEMAAQAGATFALVGHSERRHTFGETDEETAFKVAAAWRAGLTPVLCVGEALVERSGGRLESVVLRQLDAVLSAEVRSSSHDTDSVFGVDASERRLLIAYEPVWAIGTGRTATPDDASEAHGLIRERLAEALGVERSAAVPILYGGSVKPDNAADLLSASDVDGLLVGGASLDPDSFARIAEVAG